MQYAEQHGSVEVRSEVTTSGRVLHVLLELRGLDRDQREAVARLVRGLAAGLALRFGDSPVK